MLTPVTYELFFQNSSKRGEATKHDYHFATFIFRQYKNLGKGIHFNIFQAGSEALCQVFFLFCFQCKLLLESQTIVTQLLEISYIQKPYKCSLQNDGSFQTKLKCDHSIYLVQKNECCYLGFVKGVIVAVVIASVVIYKLTTSTFNGEVLFTVEYVGLGEANAVTKAIMQI